jgi:5'-deoxynucleotidase YfbR-like HD superfamily hydrolase
METQATINQWQSEVFPNRTVDGDITHLKEEFKEFLDASSLAIQAIEAADIVILLYAWASDVGINLQDHIDAKMKINRARKWRILPDGTGRHL